MTEITIVTTRSRARAMLERMQHEHISYTEEGQLVLAFLNDLETSLTKEVTSGTEAQSRVLDPRRV